MLRALDARLKGVFSAINSGFRGLKTRDIPRDVSGRAAAATATAAVATPLVDRAGPLEWTAVDCIAACASVVVVPPSAGRPDWAGGLVWASGHGRTPRCGHGSIKEPSFILN